jgi:hypothetical protein
MALTSANERSNEMENGNTALALRDERPKGLALQTDAPELSVVDLVARVTKVQEVQQQVMKEGHHFGKIPGVDKPTLLKPGAEILGMTFRLDPQFSVDERRDGEHREFLVTCTLYHAPTGVRCGSGLGSCSTRESKYAWRKGERTCPECNKPTIIKGKKEYGGGWLCFAKKGGCNAKFKDGDAAIESQSTDRVPNPDLADIYNTVLKMAVKRAHVAAILFVTCASDIFTQDVEDMSFGGHDDEPAPRQQDRRPANDTHAYQDAAKAIGKAQNREQLETVAATLKKLKISNSEKAQLRELYKMRLEEVQAQADDVIDGDFEEVREPGAEG